MTMMVYWWCLLITSSPYFFKNSASQTLVVEIVGFPLINFALQVTAANYLMFRKNDNFFIGKNMETDSGRQAVEEQAYHYHNNANLRQIANMNIIITSLLLLCPLRKNRKEWTTRKSNKKGKKGTEQKKEQEKRVYACNRRKKIPLFVVFALHVHSLSWRWWLLDYDEDDDMSC